MSLAWNGVWRQEKEAEFSAFPHCVFLAEKLPYPVSHTNLSYAHYLLRSKENIFSFFLGSVKDKAPVSFSKPACLPFWAACPQCRILVYPKEGKAEQTEQSFLTSAAFWASEAQAVPRWGGLVGARAWGCCRAHLPQLPGRAPGAAAGRENHTGHGESEGAECIPAHPWNMATVGKTPKSCVLLLTAQQNPGFPCSHTGKHSSLGLHWAEHVHAASSWRLWLTISARS